MADADDEVVLIEALTRAVYVLRERAAGDRWAVNALPMPETEMARRRREASALDDAAQTLAEHLARLLDPR